MTPRLQTLAESLKKKAAELVDPRRKYNCQDQDHSSWDERAEAAVGLLASASSELSAGPLEIADFGCGNERLRGVLSERLALPFQYQGYDLHPQSEHVERLDVKRSLPQRRFDVVFCLGLVEYLQDVELFVRRLADVCSTAVASYVVTDAAAALSSAERRKRRWLSDYTKTELEEIFQSSGFVCEASTTVDNGATEIWLWTARRPESS